MVKKLLVQVEAHVGPMGLVGTVCYVCQPYCHRDSRSVEVLNAIRGSVDDSRRCEACVLYECAAFKKWDEDRDVGWKLSRVRS